MTGNDDDLVELVDDFEVGSLEDPVSQRCYAFVHLAKYAETSNDSILKDLTYTMMKKVCSSIKSTSTADLRVIDGKPKK